MNVLLFRVNLRDHVLQHVLNAKALLVAVLRVEQVVHYLAMLRDQILARSNGRNGRAYGGFRNGQITWSTHA